MTETLGTRAWCEPCQMAVGIAYSPQELQDLIRMHRTYCPYAED